MKKEIPYRNKSPTGWWIASYVLRAEWHGEPKRKPTSKCLAWENTIILTAKNRDIAYAKAVRIALSNRSEFKDVNNESRRGGWVFEGITSLLPLYENLEDGAEILWMEHRNKMIKTIRSFVKPKEKLEVFDDIP